MTAALEFREISKQYKSFFRRSVVTALDGFSLVVEPGEIFGFLGPNGAGKTTAIHIALGLMFPSAGGGSILGQPFGNARVRRRVGFLAENVSFYNLPAAELLRFYGALNGMSKQKLAQNTRELLQVVELSDVNSRPARKLSRGMLQRLGLAQALVNDPELLILDEPTSALDPAGRVAVRELLLRLKATGTTVFLSSHLLSEIESICDRVGILHRGKLVRLGRPAELLESRDEFEIVARNASGLKIAATKLDSADGLARFTVPAALQRAAIEQIWLAGGEVVSVAPVKRSLEELFLSLTTSGAVPSGDDPSEGAA
jgi:ABC-2 type transport system ATP-binding protein